MLSAAEFRERWYAAEDAEPLKSFSAEALAGVHLPKAAKTFLKEAGLPESAAPFLDFRVPERGPLPSVAEDWHLEDAYRRYRVIGSNGSGDPICLDEAMDGAVVYLNHDARFQAIYMNATIFQLAESLLSYRQMIEETCERNGEDAYLDGDIPDEVKAWLRDELTRIDPHAMRPGSHWAIEVDNLEDLA
ncbi:SUKH-4 family immunity protein [Bremerella sp. T1]|uniref:SUKH-4 family immunity protein n=1 Tax=Bremerella sp. TYQ1 TaxID=3119568 RepID=UPI001CCFF9E3|nr:SUKH-4 family immunity protein [Bremerella volcania]UBM33697.1 SUKH-4 family immunity protein [Bremerella volcania]